MSPKEEYVDLIRYVAGLAWELEQSNKRYTARAFDSTGEDKRWSLRWAKEAKGKKAIVMDILKNLTYTYRRIEWKD